MPFIGDLRSATIYILLLNPGLSPSDYFGEYEVAAYRTALLLNLAQRFDGGSAPFLFLDPRYAWHAGFAWWHGKLAKVISQLADGWQLPFAAARRRLAEQVASLELFPYHSAAFRDSGGWLKNLPSVALARRFAHEVIVPRVARGEAIAIVTRQAALWKLPDLQGIIRYDSGQARAAHLTPDSPGGRRILDKLLGS